MSLKQQSRQKDVLVLFTFGGEKVALWCVEVTSGFAIVASHQHRPVVLFGDAVHHQSAAFADAIVAAGGFVGAGIGICPGAHAAGDRHNDDVEQVPQVGVHGASESRRMKNGMGAATGPRGVRGWD